MASLFSFGGGGGGDAPAHATPSQMVYLAVGRQRVKPVHTMMVAESFPPETPELALKLGRKMIGRKAPPGWDDINCEGWRAIKLPIHDVNGATCFVAVFGGDFDPKRAQTVTERCALLLCPMIDGQLLDGDTDGAVDTARLGAAELTQPNVLELHRTMAPILQREVEHGNSMDKIQQVQNQIQGVRELMTRNVDMILDRQEKLESIEAKTNDLKDAAYKWRRGTRKLRRWHLMNQVKWGVAVGTLVTASVAIPIAILVAA